MSDLSDEIESNAAGPKMVTGDEGSVTQHSLRDQIEADKYLSAQTAQNKKSLPIRFQKIKPEGIG